MEITVRQQLLLNYFMSYPSGKITMSSQSIRDRVSNIGLEYGSNRTLERDISALETSGRIVRSYTHNGKEKYRTIHIVQ